MKKSNTTLFILSLVMVVNALSYGTIIPLLYTYASRFGFNPFGMSLLFASFSIAQFIATPILGRMSDRFGRKPIMVICLLGTAASLATFALANTAAMIFIARIMDGITGGNNSVAQAMISDSTEGKDRTKAFGLLGASFGFGFLFGPAIGGVLSNYGLTLPFWFASFLALFAGVLSIFVLPETLKPSLKNVQQKKHEPLFKVSTLYKALFAPYTGVILMISLISAISLNAFILGFQTYTVDVLHLSAFQIGAFFSSFGLVGILMQIFAIGPVLNRFKSKKSILQFSLISSVIGLAASFFAGSALLFFCSMMFFAILGAFRDPLVTGLLSERTKPEDQGGIMGINQAYMSLGQIIGPLLAGAVTSFSPNGPFLLAAGFFLLATFATRWLFVKDKPLDL